MFTVIFYQEAEGKCPVLDFLRQAPLEAQASGRRRIEMLQEQGHRLRRPHADYLRNGIYELRWHWRRVNYRIL